jgi:hypothetical protein
MCNDELPSNLVPHVLVNIYCHTWPLILASHLVVEGTVRRAQLVNGLNIFQYLTLLLVPHTLADILGINT